MLRVTYRMRPRKLPSSEGSGSGPAGRISKMRKLVTALIRHERIEGRYPFLDESRGYAERLIMLAQRNGDQHKATMEMADYWLLEKDLIHKLFKVIVPRYAEYTSSFTKMHRLPTEYPGGINMAALELKGNPWPPVVPKERDLNNSLVNVLLYQAKREYAQQKRERTNTELLDKNTVQDLSKEIESLDIEKDSSSESRTEK